MNIPVPSEINSVYVVNHNDSVTSLHILVYVLQCRDFWQKEVDGGTEI